MRNDYSEKRKQFVYRHINRVLVNTYSRRINKVPKVKYDGLISIIILSFNRVRDTKFSIEQLYKHSKFPFEVIVLDNNSDKEQLEELKRFVKRYKNLRLIESKRNLGAARGKAEAAKYGIGKYYFFLDNDVVVTPYYMENLMRTLLVDSKTVAVCSKVIFPDCTIQFNGGTLKEDKDFYIFNLLDSGKLFWQRETINNYVRCPWVPGGSTLWRAKYYKKFPIDEKMEGSYEDNEVCIRINKAGYNVRNCPHSITIHHHMYFQDYKFNLREKKYIEGRYDTSRTTKALRRFWNVHKKAFVFNCEEATYGFLKDYSKKNIKKFIMSKDE